MIQTVTGAINKTDLGAVLMHEHISCKSLSFDAAFGEKWLDKTKLKNLACETLEQTHQKYNLGLMVDGTPIDLGRDATLLKEVSELSGVKIVASTGFYYLQSIEAFNNSPQELAKGLIKECKNGIVNGLIICVSNLVPSLFLYMILASYISGSKISLYIGAILGKPVTKLLKLPKSSASAILLSLIGGYPVGAKCVANAYKNNLLTKSQAKKLSLITVCSGTGFTLNFVGLSLYNNKKIQIPRGKHVEIKNAFWDYQYEIQED
jgi:hypothetical protein